MLLDLTLRSVDDFKGDPAASLGLKRDGSNWPPERKKLIERVAQDLYQTVLAETPNRAADDFSTITVNGKVYRNPEKLGSGGFGNIFRYTSDDGETVAVKTLKDKKNRDAMASEMRMHWQASGGESVVGPANVLPMKGAAIGKDGTLMMVMEEATGGDLNTLSESTNALSMAGLIPEAARTAMVQRTMQQVVKGLKAVHSAGMMHLDLKGLNCMLDADGNVMIGDFGQAKALEDDGAANTNAVSTTKEFAPAEHGFGKNTCRERSVLAWLDAAGDELRPAISRNAGQEQHALAGGHDQSAHHGRGRYRAHADCARPAAQRDARPRSGKAAEPRFSPDELLPQRCRPLLLRGPGFDPDAGGDLL